jgi:hypothetical protein
MPSPPDRAADPTADQGDQGPGLAPYPPYRYARAGYYVVCTVCHRGRRGHDLRCRRPLRCRAYGRATPHELHPEEIPF